MSKPENSIVLFEPGNPVAKTIDNFQLTKVSPHQMQHYGLSGEGMARKAHSLAQTASKEEGLKGGAAGVGAGLLTVGTIAVVFSAPVTLPVLALGAVIGGIFGFLPKNK